MPGANRRPKLSKRVYYAHIGKGGAPFEDLRWQIVENTGWTLEYIGALSMKDLHEYLQVLDGRSKAATSKFKR